MWLVCAGATVGSLAALASRWHWFAELFSHYRLYYLLAQAVLVMVFLNTRRYGWLAATVLLALPNAWYVGPYLLPLLPRAADAQAATQTPQIIALNLGYRNEAHERVLGYLANRQADLLVFSEYTSEWDAALGPVLVEYPHRLLRPRPDPFGMAVYSRSPLLGAQKLDLGTSKNAENFQLGAAVAGRQFEVFALHLFPPTSAARAAQRLEQLRRLTERLIAAPSPRLVIGDLNLTPFSPHFSALLEGSQLLDARRRQGLHITWPSLPLPLWIPIDHCLADPGSGVVDVRVGPAVGSDHYPLEIVLAAID